MHWRTWLATLLVALALTSRVPGGTGQAAAPNPPYQLIEPWDTGGMH